MAELEPTEIREDPSTVGAFDPTKKKKKKKDRSTTVEADADVVTEKMETLSVAEPSSDSQFLGLKKKKKKKPVEEEQTENGSEINEVKESENTSLKVDKESAEDREAIDEGDDDTGTIDLTKKKKKKKKPVPEITEEINEDDEVNEVDETNIDDEDEDDEEAMPIELGITRLPWEGTDRDYTYDEMLGRVFNILRENNPELAGEKRRTIMRPPQVLREGTKKTVFVNMMELCKTMHRQPEHVMAFLLAELGTSGSLDGQQRLVVKGRFAPKNFEGILRRYVNEYVMCSGCKSPDTILSKENRLFFLRCEQCGSGRSVAPIKAGFVARVGRRKTTA